MEQFDDVPGGGGRESRRHMEGARQNLVAGSLVEVDDDVTEFFEVAAGDFTNRNKFSRLGANFQHVAYLRRSRERLKGLVENAYVP